MGGGLTGVEVVDCGWGGVVWDDGGDEGEVGGEGCDGADGAGVGGL